MKKYSKILFLVLILTIIAVSTVPASAAEIKPFTQNGKIISVSHGGNRAEYPLNSYEAISSAFEIGADCVSLTLQTTKDSVFVISKYDDLGMMHSAYKDVLISEKTFQEIQSVNLVNNSGQITSCTLCELKKAVEVAKRYDRILIVDNAWENREMLYSFLVDNDALDNVIIRTDAKKKEIGDFLRLTDNKVQIIGSYHGNFIFSAKSYVSALSDFGCKAVMLGATNPFGVIFNQSMLSSFSANNYSARAMIATYDPDLCGQRTDTPSVWDDLIDRGYSIIETNNIRDLAEYLSNLTRTQDELKNILSAIDSTDMSACSIKTASDLQEAKEAIQTELTTLSSFESLSKVKHQAMMAFENFSLESEHYVKRGVLKVTPGKIAAVILVSAGIIAAQVYFYKMRNKKEENKYRRK